MEKTHDFSRFNRAIEIEALEMYIKESANKVYEKTVEKYGPKYAAAMFPIMLSPALLSAYGHLQQLKMEHAIDMKNYYEERREADRKFMQNMFKYSQKEETR